MKEISCLNKEILKEVAKELVGKIGDRRGSDLNDTDIDQMCQEMMEEKPKPSLSLVYRHTCKYLGCRAKECLLCMTNPHKTCLGAFDDRYYVNDTISVSKCKAPIYMDVVDSSTGDAYMDPIPELTIQMCILDGKRYQEASKQYSRVLRKEEIDKIAIINSRNGGPLLKMPGTNRECTIVVPSSSGNVQSIQLPRLICTESSESLLEGKCPPFVLYAYVVPDAWGGAYDILPVASCPFVVASRRLKNKSKVDIPFKSDSIVKLRNIGRETVSKLHNLGDVLENSDILAKVSPHLSSIDTIGQFCELASIARNDIRFETAIKQKIKFRDEIWQETVDHAMQSVPIDNRVRVWCPFSTQRSQSTVGYAFECHAGEPNITFPIGVVKYFPGEDEHVACKLEHIPGEYKTMLQSLQSLWQQSWKMDGHPGWGIENLETSELISSSSSAKPYFFFKSSMIAHNVLHRNTEMWPLVPTSAFAQVDTTERVPSIGDEILEMIPELPSVLNESMRLESLLSGELELSIARQMSLDHVLKRKRRKYDMLC